MKTCIADDCKKKQFSVGYCSMHYSRLRRNGDINTLRKSPPGSGCITSHGYKKISVEGRRIYEHQFVVEKAIGRKLIRGEIIHHINHDTLDNRIENLELTNQSAHSKHHNTKTFRNKTHKQCTKCLVIKPREQFSRVPPNGPNGDWNKCYCKSCSASMRKRNVVRHVSTTIVPTKVSVTDL